MSEKLSKTMLTSLSSNGVELLKKDIGESTQEVDPNEQEFVTFLCSKTGWAFVEKRNLRNSFWDAVFMAIEKTSKRKYESDERRRLSMSLFLLEELEKKGLTIRSYN